MPCDDLPHVIHMMHSHIAYKHAATLSDFFPSAFAKRPLLFVPEGNTFEADVTTLNYNFSHTCEILLGKKPSLYANKYSRFGFITTAETKFAAASIMSARMRIDTLYKFEHILSFSDELRTAFKTRDAALDRETIQIMKKEEWGQNNDPLNYLANPTTAEELALLPDVDRIRFFKLYGGINLSRDIVGKNIEQGAVMFEELCDQMARIVLDDSTKTPHIKTGGKQYNKGIYTRDDLYAALSIAVLIGESYMYAKGSWVTL